ncbi:gamma-tubulin complex associated protein [Cryptosporidium canis]|uniref:Gamma-tubulin complex associated protein n=1 Tax=Cryptosporidium canis TaxID=195482 RepID=A0A9D5DKR4_9CRYT|nr:gamma-tubulin complex associated protein [Cryptosporidium canis]
MNISLPTVTKVIKQGENKYVLFGDKISIRACNKNCEYLTVFRDNDNWEENYTLGLSNLNGNGRIESTNITDVLLGKYKFHRNVFSNSEFYLLNSNQLLNNYNSKHEYIQYNDDIYIATITDSEIFIIGFDQSSNQFLISNLEEVVHYLENRDGQNMDSPQRIYEWRLENVPISKELLLNHFDTSSVPNAKSVKYNELLQIKLNNDQIICISDYKPELKLQYSKLSIGNILLNGKNGFWTIITSKSIGTVYPDWFLLKKTLRTKHSSPMKFLDSRIVEKFTKNKYSLQHKDYLFRVGCMDLVSEPPIGWDITNLRLSEDESTSSDPKVFSEKEINEPPSASGFIFDHAKFGIDCTMKHNIAPCKLGDFSIKIQEQLILEDVLSCLLCNDGNYIKVIERIIEIFPENGDLDNISENLYFLEFGSTLNFDNLKIKSLISGKEGLSLFLHQIIDDPGNFNNNENHQINFREQNSICNLKESFEIDNILSANNLEINPSLYPLTYKLLELSTLNRRIRQFLKVHESGNSLFGVISGSLCSTFRELLKHFATKVSKFEFQLRKGQLTIQSIWSNSQQALVTLKVLDLISMRVLHKRGCEIIDQVYNIINNELKGDFPSQKIGVFIFNQLFLTWCRHFLVPWLKFGVVSDHSSEFTNQQLTDLRKKSIICMNYSHIYMHESVFPSFIFPSFLQESFGHVNYIGLVSFFICRKNHLYSHNILQSKGHEDEIVHFKMLENMLEQIINSLDNSYDQSGHIGIKEYITNMFLESQRLLFKACNSITNIKSQINSFFEIFFCTNDMFIEEFIEYICILEQRVSKPGYDSSTDIVRKWDELMTKYYKGTDNSVHSIWFLCNISDNLITDYSSEELFSPIKWEIGSYVLNEIGSKPTRTEIKKIPSFEIFKYLTVESYEIILFGSNWPRELLKKYETIFRLIFHLKYINHLLNKVWVIHQTFNIWSNKLPKTKYLSINKELCKSYLLRQKMLLLITGILEYIYNDVINPLWDSMVLDLNNVSTLEEFNSRQDQLLNEVLTQCFFLEKEQLNSLYSILSLCHLFTRHSNLLSIYWSSNQTATDTHHRTKSSYLHKKFLQLSNKNSCHKGNSLGKRGRSPADPEYLENLLLEPTYNEIVDKFSSKFEKLLQNFFNNISNCKYMRASLLNKLILRLNYNGYYLEAPISTHNWGEPKYD